MTVNLQPFVGQINVAPPIVIIPPIWLLGEGIPSDDLGVDTDFYIDTLTFDIYQKKLGHWT